MICRKSVEKIPFPLESDNNNGTAYGDRYVHLGQHLAGFFLELEVFQTKFVDKV
jgi:hypothetical protein